MGVVCGYVSIHVYIAVCHSCLCVVIRVDIAVYVCIHLYRTICSYMYVYIHVFE